MSQTCILINFLISNEFISYGIISNKIISYQLHYFRYIFTINSSNMADIS